MAADIGARKHFEALQLPNKIVILIVIVKRYHENLRRRTKVEDKPGEKEAINTQTFFYVSKQERKKLKGMRWSTCSIMYINQT